MKTCFSDAKLMKQCGNPPLSKRTPLFLSNFFMTPLFAQISETRPPPLILVGGWGGGGENYETFPIIIRYCC